MHKKRKTSGVHTSSRKPTKKCVMKMKETNKEKMTRVQNVIDRMRAFIGRVWQNSIIDCKELLMAIAFMAANLER